MDVWINEPRKISLSDREQLHISLTYLERLFRYDGIREIKDVPHAYYFHRDEEHPATQTEIDLWNVITHLRHLKYGGSNGG